MRVILLLTGLIYGTQSWAQISQPDRWERELKFAEDPYSLVSLQKEGLALIRDQETSLDNKKKWDIIILDTTLHESWNTTVMFEHTHNFVGYEYAPGRLNLMFRSSQLETLKASIVDVDLNAKTTTTSETEVKLQIKLSHYTVADGNSVFGGYVGAQPALVVFDPQKGKSNIVPGFFLPDTELLDVRPNKNSTFNVLLAQSVQGKKKLIFRTFDKFGNILVDDNIRIDDQKTILSGASSILEHDEILIAGTFGFNNSKAASGIFSCLVNPFSEQPVQYTEFHQLNHFLDYLSDKKAARIREKANSREGYGKNPEYKTYVAVHRVEEFPGGFALFGETYLVSAPSSNNYYSNPYYYNPYMRTTGLYSPYGGNRYYYTDPYYRSNMGPSEFRMQQAFVVSFDFKGNRLGDFALELKNRKTLEKEQVADFVINHNATSLLYAEANTINFLRYGEDTVRNIEPVHFPIRLNSSFEESRGNDDDEGNIRYWYRRSFYAWGTTNIRDSRPKVPNKRVFFVNKIVLD